MKLLSQQVFQTVQWLREVNPLIGDPVKGEIVGSDAGSDATVLPQPPRTRAVLRPESSLEALHALVQHGNELLSPDRLLYVYDLDKVRPTIQCLRFRTITHVLITRRRPRARDVAGSCLKSSLRLLS